MLLKKSVNAAFNWHIFFVISCAIVRLCYRFIHSLCVCVCVVYMSTVDSSESRGRENPRRREKTLTNPANYRVIKYIRGAYLVRRNLVENYSTCNAIVFENWTELGITSAITNFRIMCTTFIIIDLRGFFHSTRFFVLRGESEKKRIWRYKRALERTTLEEFFFILCSAVCVRML